MQDADRHIKEVAALRYDPDRDDVPQLVASGRGYVAQNILKTAREAGVPVVEDQDLAHLLAQLSAGDDIPPELYTLVAQVLLFVSNMDQAFAARLGLPKPPR